VCQKLTDHCFICTCVILMQLWQQMGTMMSGCLSHVKHIWMAALLWVYISCWIAASIRLGHRVWGRHWCHRCWCIDDTAGSLFVAAVCPPMLLWGILYLLWIVFWWWLYMQCGHWLYVQVNGQNDNIIFIEKKYIILQLH
jgi:hypothetical protein